MAIIQKVMETVVQFIPDAPQDPLIARTGYVGQSIQRVDGAAKVTGQAPFTAEHAVEGLAHASLVHSTIARGRIATIDVARAEAADGVIAVITPDNAPRMKRPPLVNVMRMDRGFAGSDLPILQDREVHWNGQPVAVVVAETADQAEHAASLVHVEYEPVPARVSFDAHKHEATTPSAVLGEPAKIEKGNAERALAAAPFKVDHVYTTPPHNQNALELHATMAMWNEDGSVTVFDSTQFVNGLKHVLAAVFGLSAGKVRVIAAFVGGGFGGKAAMWSHTALCVAAAKAARRPVRLVLSREGVFRIVGGRTPSEQRVAIGADANGRFTSIIHTGTTATTTHADNPEQFSFTVRHLYAAKNILAAQQIVNLDTVANSWMRAPGESIGTFALESAIDELAHAMRIDPIALRRGNEPARDPTKDTEFSSRHLVEVYERGAKQFGWDRRRPDVRSQRDGRWLVGQGVATAYYPVFRFAAKVRIRLLADGTAVVQAAANEMGMGTATVQIQHAADRLGLPLGKVAFAYGDSAFPDAPVIAGGSSQTASLVAAVHAAADKLVKELVAMAAKASPLAGASPEDVEARDEGLYLRSSGEGASYRTLIEQSGKDFVEVEAGSGMPLETMKYSMASHGAQFCEVRVDEDTGEVRVTRWLGAFDCGRILNPRTAESQLRGGIVMGIGMALAEETVFDARNGRIVTRSLADYHVPVHLDVPPIEILCTDMPDEHAPLGAHGVGEIGITGVAAAIANAVFHATGKRVRELPITLDKLL